MDKKKIVFVLTRLGGPGWGGAHKVAVIVANYLANKNYDVTIISRETTEIDYPIASKIKVQFLGVSDKGWKGKVNCLLKYRQALKRHKGSIVITFTSMVTMYIFLVSPFLKIRIIAAERTDPHREPHNFIIRIFRNFIFSNVYRTVFQTQDALEYFPSKAQKNGIVIPNPVADSLPVRYKGIRRKEIVNYCRLDRQKNLPLLIDVFYTVHKKYPEYTLKIYGTGIIEKEIKDYVAELHAEDYIFIVPFCKNIHEKVVDSAMYVSSSDYEGLSNSMLEALAMGIPCICTDCSIGGAKMVIKSYENGILVPVGDKERMIEAILELIENHELSEKLSINAVKLRKELNINSICEKWEKFIIGE